MTTLWLWHDFSPLALSEMAILAGLFCAGLLSYDEQKSSFAYRIIVALGLIGLGIRAYDHGAYSAIYPLATAAVGIALAIVLAGLGTARSSLIAGSTLVALPHKACPIFLPPTDGGVFIISYIAALVALTVASVLLRSVFKAEIGMNLYRISALSALATYLNPRAILL